MASMATLELKWMSAIIGICVFSLIVGIKRHESISGIAIRIKSHPADSNSLICLIVVLVSLILQLVIDCTETGWFPPIFNLPISTILLFLLLISLDII